MQSTAQNTLEYIEGWLDITIDKFHEALDEHNIGKLDGQLWRSIMGEVIRSGEEPKQVIIRFKQYGRFVDMGVGRGVPLGKRGSAAFSKYRNHLGTSMLKNYARTAKPWYSKTKTRELGRLRELLAINLAGRSVQEISAALINGVIIRL